MSRWLGVGTVLVCALVGWVSAPTGVCAEEATPEREMRALLRGGGALGVSLDEVGPDDASRLRLPEERGALVRSVEPDSPASAAGLQADDVIVSYQGQPVQSAAQLSRMVRETPAGRKVALEVSRGGASQKLTATLREGRRGFLTPGDFDFDFDVPLPAIDIRPPRPPRAPRAPRPPAGELDDFDVRELWGGRRGRLGLTYQELTDQLARYFKVDGGLLVSSVKEGSPAAAAGIQAGDVIVRANGKAVRSSEDLRDQLDAAEPGAEVTLGLQREGRALEVKAKLADPDGGARRVHRRGVRS
jgi:serine protease Do